MSAVIQIDTTQAQADVNDLNASIMDIAKNIGAIQSAGTGSNPFAPLLGSASAASSAITNILTSVRALNAELTSGGGAIGRYVEGNTKLVSGAQQVSTAVLATVRAMKENNAATNDAANAQKTLTAAQALATMTFASQERVIRSTMTAAQLQAAVNKDLARLEINRQITMQQSLRYQELMTDQYRKTGTAAEVMLATLRQETSLFGASNAALAEATAGWRTMNSTQQAALVTQLNVQSAIKQTGTWLDSSASMMGEYNRNLMALNTLQQNGIAIEGGYASALARLNREFDDQLSKVKAAQKAMEAKSYADTEAGKRAKDVADAIQRTSGVMRQGIDPVSQYVARLKDLNTAMAGGTAFGGQKIGISLDQYNAGLRGARAELDKNIASTIRAGQEHSVLAGKFGVSTQAAAGFRAALQGANLGFGIFTSNTIVAATAAYGITKAMSESVRAGAAFQDTFNRAAVIAGYFGAAMDKPKVSIAGYRAEITGLAETTRYTSAQVAEAATALGQAGQDAGQQMAALPTVLDFATVGMISTSEAADKLVNVLAAFGLQATDTAATADKITAAALASTTTVGDLASGLGQVGATAHAAGVGLTDTLAALAALRQVGIQASKTGTDLRNIIQSISTPTARASAALNKLHLDSDDFFSGPGGGLDLVKMFKDLSGAMDGMSNKTKVGLFTDLFGKRSSGAALEFTSKINDATNGMTAYIDKIEQAQGKTKFLADVINNNAATAFSQFKNLIENISIDAFDQYSGKLTASIREFADYVRSNGPAISKTIADITNTLIDLTKWLVQHAAAIATIIVTYEGWRVAVALAGTAVQLKAKIMDAYAANMMRAAATAEANALAEEQAAVARAQGTAALVAEDAALAANTTAKVANTEATVAAGVAARGAAVGGMAQLSSAGGALFAAMGGWATVAIAAAAGLIYLGVQAYKSSQQIEVPLQDLEDSFRDVKQAANDLSVLDSSGLSRFGATLKNEIEKDKAAIVDLQHNIDLYKEQINGADLANAMAGINAAPVINAAAQEEVDRLSAAMQNLVNHVKEFQAASDKVDLQRALQIPEVDKFMTDMVAAKVVVSQFGGEFDNQAPIMAAFFDTLYKKGRISSEQLKLLKGDIRDLSAGIDINAAMDRLDAAAGPFPVAPKRPKITDDFDTGKAARESSELANELKSVINEFEKATDASSEFGRQFEQVDKIAASFANKKVAAAMRDLGISADEAKAALEWKSGDITFNSLKKQLTDLNPAFKDLIDPGKDLVKTSDDIGDAFALIDTIVSKMVAKSPEQAAAITKMGEAMKGQLDGLLTGATKAGLQFDAAVKGAQTSIDKVFRADNFDSFISDAADAGREMTATSVGANAWAAAVAILGGNEKAAAKAIQGVTDAGVQANDITSVYLALAADPRWKGHEDQLHAIQLAMQQVYDATPLGSLEKSNRDIQNQIDLIKSGSNNLEEYQTLWKLTNGNISAATQGMKDAAHASALLNEELGKMQAQQQIFKSLADSLGSAFSKVFDGGKDSLKNFVKDVKSSFKQLLLDMIKQAATNQILFYMGFNQSGAGGGGGSLGSWMSALGSLFGGGGGGGGGWASAIGSLFGATGGGTSSNTSGWNITDLAATAASGNSSYNGTYFGGGGTGGGGGGFGGAASDAYNLYSAGTRAYNVVSGGWGNIGSNLSSQTGYGTFMNGSGQMLPGAQYLGSSVYGPGMQSSFVPSGLGAGLAVAGGLYAGYNRYQQGGALGGAAGGITYAIGGTALGLGAAGVATGVGFSAGVAGGATALGATGAAAAAIPVIGWIALIAMVVDMIAGGRLFGTDANKLVGGGSTMDFKGGTDPKVTDWYTLKGEGALFSGSYTETKNMDATPEQIAAANKVWQGISQAGTTAARQLGVTLDQSISGSFETGFDKNGKVTKEISHVLNKTYNEPLEDFVKRMAAENVVNQIGASIAAMGGNADEASKIAEQFRSDASTFADAANFMLAAQVDIKNNDGLLRQKGGDGVLTATVAIVQKLATAGETLSQTYSRLVEETNMVDSIFNTVGDTIQRSGVDYVQFSDDFVTAMGGLDKAKAQWTLFATTFYAGIDQISTAKSSGNLGGELSALGLSATTTLTQFSTAFKQVAGSLTATELAQWVAAGAALAGIDQTMQIMQGMADGVDISGVLSQQQQLVQSVNDQINAAAKLGASEEQLTRLRELGKQAIEAQLGDFMQGIGSQLGKYEGGDYLIQLEKVNQQMRQNIDTAQALGASTQQLADIQRLATYQSAEIIANLTNALRSSIASFNGTASSNASSGLSSQLANQANDGRNALLEAQRDLYNAAQSAMKDISDFLDELQTGDLSTNDWQGQLSASQTQFNELVTRAQGGDTDAMAQLTQYAGTYLQHAQDAYGNSAEYGNILASVTATLQALHDQFALITAPPENQVSNNNNAGGNNNAQTPVDATQAANDRYQLALTIAQQLGQLGVALGTDVFELADKMGVKLTDLMKAMHIDFTNMDAAGFSNVTLLASALKVSVQDLLTEMGKTPEQIGNIFKTSVELINAGNLANIKDLAAALGISAFDAIKYLGGDLATAIKANGIDITSLDPNTMTALGTIATTLGVSIVDLLTQLGLTASQIAGPMADAITAQLAALPGISAETVAGLTPLLAALGTAITTGDLNTALGNIGTYLATLPEDQRTALQTLFDGLGIKLDATTGAQDRTTTATDNIATNSALMVSDTGQMVTSLQTLAMQSSNMVTVLKDIRDGTNTALPANDPSAGGDIVRPGGTLPPRGSGGLVPPGTGPRGPRLPTPGPVPGAMTAYFDPGSGYDGGRQLHAVAVETDGSMQRGAEASAETARHVQAVAQQVGNLTRVVSAKLNRVAEEQGKTTHGVTKLRRTVKVNTISRSLRK